MPATSWKPEYTSRAHEIWEEYSRQHDLSAQIGHVAAIDPTTGQVWIAESGVDVAEKMAAEGVEAPVYLVRIGSAAYVRKGQHPLQVV